MKQGASSKPWLVPFGVGLLMSVACDFGGDRSLGTIAQTAPSMGGATGSTATTDAGGNKPVGGSPTSETTSVIQAGGSTTSPGCHPNAQPAECGENQYCQLDSSCGTRDSASLGTCRDRPATCEQPNGNEMVCGCDGVLHDSSCVTELAGITVTGIEFCRVPCLAAVDCRKLERYCLDSLGVEATGADCDAKLRICTCGGPSHII